MVSTSRKVLELFDRSERWSLAGLCVVTVLVALIQTVGVASVMPFMRLVADTEILSESEWMRRLYDLLGFESTRAFLVFAGIVVLAMMAFSNASAAFGHWLMFRFIWKKQHRLSVRLLDKYLREPYTFFLNQNTSDLAKNVLAEVREVINGVLMPGMTMLAQIFVIVFIFGLLLIVDAAVALAAAIVLGGSYAAIFVLVRRRQGRLGVVRRTANTLRFKTSAEALGSVKETKVLGTEAEFLRRFAVWNRRYSNANASNAIVRDIPRYALETLAFGGIVLIVLYLLQTRDDFGQAVAVMSLYAMAGYRLMPALQQVFRGLAQVRFFVPALDNLHADLKESTSQVRRHLATTTTRERPMSYERKIALDGIGYRYPETQVDVIRGISFEIRKNTSVAFVGSTGCGKTTLVDLLLGLLEPQDGSIRVDDVVLSPENISSWRQRVGYVPQHIYLCDDTVTQNIALGVPAEEVDRAAVERAASIAHLHEFIVSLADGYDTVVGERGVRLSGGQRQRIGIARALYRDPDVLIFDEATSALDGITEDTIIQAIRHFSGRKTIMLVAHRLSTIKDCDVIHLFDSGNVVASGTYLELMQTSSKFRAMAKGTFEEAAVT